MPDPLSPIQRTVTLRRVDPEHGMAPFYSLMIERDLFGTRGRERADVFDTEVAAEALERLAAVKRLTGYQDLYGSVLHGKSRTGTGACPKVFSIKERRLSC